MPIDWTTIEQDADTAIANGKAKTDQQLASKISGLTRLTDEEIKKLLPTPADAKALAVLMGIVRSSGDRNAKAAQLIDNIQEVAGTVVALLGKVV